MATEQICILCHDHLGSKLPVKQLWCGHSFCGVCIEDYHYRRHSPKMVMCPDCGAEMLMPEDRVDDLPVNHDYDIVEEEAEGQKVTEISKRDSDSQKISESVVSFTADSCCSNGEGSVSLYTVASVDKEEMETEEKDLSTKATMTIGPLITDKELDLEEDFDLLTVPECSLIIED